MGVLVDGNVEVAILNDSDVVVNVIIMRDKPESEIEANLVSRGLAKAGKVKRADRPQSPTPAILGDIFSNGKFVDKPGVTPNENLSDSDEWFYNPSGRWVIRKRKKP